MEFRLRHHDYPDPDFGDVPQSFLANARKVPRLCYDLFFQIPSHLSFLIVILPFDVI
jgi:hypothetical protein